LPESRHERPDNSEADTKSETEIKRCQATAGQSGELASVVQICGVYNTNVVGFGVAIDLRLVRFCRIDLIWQSWGFRLLQPQERSTTQAKRKNKDE
jgi:hypothetical protein